MGYYKQEFDPVKSLEDKTKIPKSLIDLPQIIAEKQSRKLWSRFLQADSEDKKILEFFREFWEVNRLHEQIVTIEELCSLFGQVIICLDKYKDSVPLISYADPYMLSRIGKFHIQEKVASVFNMKDQIPKVTRVETVSTVHIAQTPLKEKDNKYGQWEPKESYKTYDYKWDKDDIVLVDKNFNTLADPRKPEVIARFGKYSDDRRLYTVRTSSFQSSFGLITDSDI